MHFAEHGINTKSVDIGLNYLNMKFGPNRMIQNRENDKKKLKMRIF